MNRSAGVTASAVVVIVGCAFCILIGLFAIAGAFLIPSRTPQPPFFKFTMAFSVALFIGGSLLGIATAVGLLRLRRWARISLLIFSGLLAFFAGISVLFILAVPIPVRENLPAETIRMTRMLLSVFYLFLIALGASWLYLFNTRAVKDQFLGTSVTAPAGPGPQRPLSIVVIAWIMLIGGCLSLPLSLLHLPAVFLGVALSGWSATLVYMAWGVAELFLGFGLLKLKPLSRTLAVYFFLFGILNNLAFFFLPGRDARFAAMMKLQPLGLAARNLPFPSSLYWLSFLFGMVLMLVTLWFLIRRKEAFLAASRQTQIVP